MWRIQVPRGRRVTLRFDNFNIESHSNCRYDYVDVSILFLEIRIKGVFMQFFCGVKCSKQRKPLSDRGCRGRGRMVVGFTTTYVISAYRH